jgi:DNA topoisomerase-1
VEKKERKLYPHPPFKTSTLQQAAANVLGWSAKKTMAVAQRLYEKGAITYHRTDSLHIVESAVASIREVIGKKFGNEYLSEKEIYYKTSGKVVAQEAHEGIRPTQVEVTEITGEEVDRDEEKLYQLVWRRTISCQMKPAIVDQVVVWVLASSSKEKYSLKAIGETYKFASWKKLYKLAEDVVLPVVTEREKLTKKQITTEQKFTLAPARFNDASLIKELEKRGIGRPSTYAPTISTIIVRGYVERKEKRFFATQIGLTVTDFLMANFPKEMEYEFTAKMEGNLDEIATGEKKWQEVLSEFYGPFEKTVEKATKEAKRVKMPVTKTGKACPLCQEGEVVIRTGRFGKFYSCSRFPECKYTAKLIEYVEGAVCPKDGGKIVVKRTHTGREFYGCENYPKCDYASWRKPKAPGEADEVVEEKAAI